MLPLRLGYLDDKAPIARRRCLGVFCTLNQRQFLPGRPYTVPGVGTIELAQVSFPGRLPILSYLLNNDRPIAIWRLRRAWGSPVMMRTILESGNRTVLPWRVD